MEITIAIPARLNSKRLPQKVLADLNGKPILQHVWEQAATLMPTGSLYVIADSPKVAAIVEAWGGKAILSDPECQSGTERIASVITQLPGNYIVNLQADEPFVNPSILTNLIQCAKVGNEKIITPIFKIDSLTELLNTNTVKVITAKGGKAIYFSRSPIPYIREYPQEAWLAHHTFYGHMGIYCYHRKFLERYSDLQASSLEKAERLEQLLWMENGYGIHTFLTPHRSISIDTMEDLHKARHHMDTLLASK